MKLISDFQTFLNFPVLTKKNFKLTTRSHHPQTAASRLACAKFRYLIGCCICQVKAFPVHLSRVQT